MTNAIRLIAKIRAHKGKIHVPVQSRDDVIHVVVEKKSLIEQLSRMGDCESGYALFQMDDGSWTIDAR